MEAESKSKSKVNWVWKILVAIVAALAIGATGWMIGRSGRSSSKSRGSSDSSAREERMESKNPVYEARSEFTMDTRRCRGNANGNDMDSYGSNYEEIFEERLADWRSEALYTKIIQQYRASNPIDTVTDRELIETLRRAELELVRHSRLITIAVRSESPELAAALANAYAQAIESFTDEENKKRCDKAVARVHEQVEKQQFEDSKLASKLLDFRMENKIDSLEAQRTILNQSLSTATTNVLDYEKRVMATKEWMGVLEAVQKSCEKFGELPTGVPQSSEITAAYTKRQTAKSELDSVSTWAGKDHPDFVAKEKNFTMADEKFKDAVARAYKKAKGDLTADEGQLQSFRRKRDELKKRIDDIGLRFVKVDATLKQLEQEKKISSEIYQSLLQKENLQRIAAEQENEIVRVGRPATVPTSPVNSGGSLLKR